MRRGQDGREMGEAFSPSEWHKSDIGKVYTTGVGVYEPDVDRTPSTPLNEP